MSEANAGQISFWVTPRGRIIGYFAIILIVFLYIGGGVLGVLYMASEVEKSMPLMVVSGIAIMWAVSVTLTVLTWGYLCFKTSRNLYNRGEAK